MFTRLIYSGGQLRIYLINRCTPAAERGVAIDYMCRGQVGPWAVAKTTLEDDAECNRLMPQLFMLGTTTQKHAGHAYFQLEGYDDRRYWKGYEVWIHPSLRLQNLAEFLLDACLQYLGQSYDSVGLYDFHKNSKITGLFQKKGVKILEGIPHVTPAYITAAEAAAFDCQEHIITVKPAEAFH